MIWQTFLSAAGTSGDIRCSCPSGTVRTPEIQPKSRLTLSDSHHGNAVPGPSRLVWSFAKLSNHSLNRLIQNMSNDAAKIPKLDLHGFTKEVAVRRFTDFMDLHASSTGSSWVCVVTGSGSHSLHGPVLRTEITRLLDRRQIEYKKQTPGSFLVNAASGLTFHAPEPPTDTKVIVQQQQLQTANDLMVQEFMRNAQAGRVKAAIQPFADPITRSSEHQSTAAACLFPSVQEVHREDSDMAQAKNESLKLGKRLYKSDENQSLQAAIVLSQQQLANEQHDEEAAVLQAMEVSKRHADMLLKAEQELIKKVLEESRLQAELDRRQELVLMRNALEESKRTAEIQRNDEVEQLRIVMEESIRQAESDKEREQLILDKVLVESQRLAEKALPDDEVEEQMRMVMEESTRYAEAQRDEELDQMRIVMEDSIRQAEWDKEKDRLLLDKVLEESQRLADVGLPDDERLLMERALRESERLSNEMQKDADQGLLSLALAESERLEQQAQLAEEGLLQLVLKMSQQDYKRP
jgi:hypothetical protein